VATLVMVFAYAILFPCMVGGMVLLQCYAMPGLVLMGNQREINVPTRHTHSRLCQQDAGKQERQQSVDGWFSHGCSVNQYRNARQASRRPAGKNIRQ
jgi:hypothetical protein